MSISEFQLIQSYFSEPEQVSRPDLVLGIGDDCAITAPKEEAYLAFSIDTLISGVHFPDNTPPEAIAYKALAVNLSDLAAMGAEPAWFTLSLTLPEDEQNIPREDWLEQFSQSLFSLAKEHNIQLIGGDTTCGPLSVTIQVCGYVDKQGGMKRSGAKSGDLIVVTGSLGAAAIGLDIALQQNEENFLCLSSQIKQLALDALNYPKARIKEGLSLKNIAHSALDLSDGLLSDLGHILKASNVGAELILEKLPLSTSLACLDKKSAWEKALTGGDDYELCFTLAEKDWPDIKAQFPQFVAVGTITEQNGLRLLEEVEQNSASQYSDLHDVEMKEYKIDKRGYDHFG
ncbi:MAG: thiamine-phosphate kinase [Gammaproteobacteria bacterium]|nr:thiamine-phosphate kinase [Gammaproteobacteria bacterium]